jgi:hypothetical protein
VTGGEPGALQGPQQVLTVFGLIGQGRQKAGVALQPITIISPVAAISLHYDENVEQQLLNQTAMYGTKNISCGNILSTMG